MSQPLTPRLEQVRQAILVLLGDPDTTLATLADLLTAGNDAAELRRALLATIGTTLEDGLLSPGGLSLPTAGTPLLLATFSELDRLRGFYENRTAGQLAGDVAAAEYLPQLETVPALLNSIILTTAATRDALAHNPGQGQPVVGVVDLLININDLLEAVTSNQMQQIGQMAVMNQTLTDLLACCEGDGGEPVDPYRPFPAGECDIFTTHIRFIPSGPAVASSAAYPRWFLLRVEDEAALVALGFEVRQMTSPAGNTWTAFRSTLNPRSFCLAYSREPSLGEGHNITLARVFESPAIGQPEYEDFFPGTVDLAVYPMTSAASSSYVTIPTLSQGGGTEDYWYALIVRRSDGEYQAYSQGDVAAWISAGAAG